MHTDLLLTMLASQIPVAAAGYDVKTVMMIAWGVCGFLMLVLSLMIAAWLYRDCKARNVSPALWTVLGIVPVFNIAALCAYVFTEGRSNAEFCERHQQPLIPGQDKCFLCFQEEVQQQQQQLIEQMRAEQEPPAAEPEAAARDVPILNTGAGANPRATAAIASVPSTVISLQQIGGVRHGTTTNLATRNALNQPIRNTIGRDASCSLAIADDENISQLHCSIGEDQDGNFYVADLDSLNGTFIIRDGQETRVQSGRQTIEDGDVLRVGRTEFRVIITRPPAPRDSDRA